MDDKIISQVALECLAHVRAAASKLALQSGEPESKILAQLLDALDKHKPVGAQAEKDKRAVYWRIRIQLFNPAGDLVADTDPERAQEAPGTEVVRSLPAVAERLNETLQSFHTGQQLGGVTMPELTHRIKSLRPTLSRRGGNASWRVPYMAGNLPWRAHVDVRREDS